MKSQKTESAELTDLKQYVTNLLYAAHEVNETPFNSSHFDKWVDGQVNNLGEYFAQSYPQVTVPSDEEVNKKIFEICTRMRQWDGKDHPVTVPELMTELATWFKNKLTTK